MRQKIGLLGNSIIFDVDFLVDELACSLSEKELNKLIMYLSTHIYDADAGFKEMKRLYKKLGANVNA